MDKQFYTISYEGQNLSNGEKAELLLKDLEPIKKAFGEILKAYRINEGCQMLISPQRGVFVALHVDNFNSADNKF